MSRVVPTDTTDGCSLSRGRRVVQDDYTPITKRGELIARGGGVTGESPYLYDPIPGTVGHLAVIF